MEAEYADRTVELDHQLPAIGALRMAGLIHLELLTDFFNKIGPLRHLIRRNDTSGVEVKADSKSMAS